MISQLWKNLGRGARIGLVAGVLVIAVGLAAAASLIAQRDYEVLFSQLAPADAATLVAELERRKVPYRLEAGGTTIMVERERVPRTRLALMAGDVPLGGTVGFELFNNADFSMSEFAQKVNYQRALQGEITRTILSIDEIKSARVHLALPEEGLFKRAQQKPKASVTVALKPGRSLAADQISGIQRLVAAAVPGIVAQDVTLVDQRGVALTRASDGEPEMAGSSARLDLKKDTEGYLARKATEVLNRTFGPGQALASVDVALNMDAVKTTTEEVIGAPAAAGRAPTGVVVRERENVRDAGVAPEGNGARGGSQTSREYDYQVGRRVEQVVSQPGSVRRIQVVAVVKPALDEQQIANLKQTLAAAVGASLERGDTVVVQTLAGVPAAAADEVVSSQEPASVAPSLARDEGFSGAAVLALGGLAAGLGLGLAVALAARRKSAPEALSQAQREALLSRINRWVGEAAARGPGERG